MEAFWWWPFGEVAEVSVSRLDANAPVTELDARLAGLRLDRTRPIVATCRAGGRSKIAVRLLQRDGLPVVDEAEARSP
jgi:rhodanese-related sulfurtransferase